MRQLVIDMIRRSSWYSSCIENGLQDQLPVLEKEDDTELLNLLIFVLTH